MPVIVVGADTDLGERLVARFGGQEREVRAFVTDPETVGRLRQGGAKVAVGDISDDTHLAGACLGCFTAVLVMDADTDQRPRSFAVGSEAVLASWVEAVKAAKVQRVIWVGDSTPPVVPGCEVAVARATEADVIDEVHRLDELASLR